MEIHHTTNICFETPLCASSLLIMEEMKCYIAAWKHHRRKKLNFQEAVLNISISGQLDLGPEAPNWEPWDSHYALPKQQQFLCQYRLKHLNYIFKWDLKCFWTHCVVKSVLWILQNLSQSLNFTCIDRKGVGLGMEQEGISEWGYTKGTGSRHGAGWSEGIKASEGSKPMALSWGAVRLVFSIRY